MKALPASFGEEQKLLQNDFQANLVGLKTETVISDQGIDVETKRIELLSVHDIQHYMVVPDFQTSSSCSYPIVVNENGILQCIANWHMVQHAIDDGGKLIEFLVIIPANPSPEDTAVRKLASRIKTLAGSASYPELLKGYKAVRNLLLQSNINMVTYSHGGSRQGEEYTGEKINDLYLLLANRLGKCRETIRNYNGHSSYVNDEALNHLHAEGTTKKDFGDFYSEKLDLIQDLTEENLTKAEITEKVSEFVLFKFRGDEPELKDSEKENAQGNSEETDKSPEDEGNRDSEEAGSEETSEEPAEESPERTVTLQDYQQTTHESWKTIMPFFNTKDNQSVDLKSYYQKLQEHNERVMALMSCVKAQLDSSLSS